MTSTPFSLALRRIYRSGVSPCASHKARLEEALLNRFSELSFQRPKRVDPSRIRLVRRASAVLLAVLTVTIASQAPAQYQVTVGKRVEIAWPETQPFPGLRVLAPVLQGLGTKRVSVRAERASRGAIVVAELRGDTIVNDVPGRIRAAFPQLAKAPITVTSLQGSLRGTLLDKVIYQLLGVSDPQRIARARRALEDHLAAEGKHATVDIEAYGQKRFQVKIHTNPADGQGNPEPPGQSDRPARTQAQSR